MQGRKYFWENDYLAAEPVNYPKERTIVLQPTVETIDKYQFSNEHLEKITSRIFAAIEANHKIAICGDYDVDGITATVILLKALTELGANVIYYIPNRFTDGYGINQEIVKKLQADAVELIITVDNGIVATEAVDYCNQFGMEIIITDHHHVEDELPNTEYILHPKLDKNLEDYDICGAAVAYLLAKALLLTQTNKILTEELLELAALGTLADMMPLDQEFNRAISYIGFQKIKNSPPVLIEQFIKLKAIEKFDSDDLSFQLIPCLNAVGRMKDANKVVAAFLTTDSVICQKFLEEFISDNTERKSLTQTIYQEIISTLPQETITEPGFLFIHGENLHQGILGIVAQRLMQHFQRPVILVSSAREDENIYTGSARGFGFYNVKDCFSFLGTDLLKSGGHQYAGGLAIEKQNLNKVAQRLLEYNEKILATAVLEDITMPLFIDNWMSFSELKFPFLEYQDKFAPFGEHNKKFNIGIKAVKIKEIQELGKTKQHVKLTVIEGGKSYQIVAFNMYDLLADIAKYACVDVVVEVQMNHYNGTERVQYLLVDIRPPEIQIFDYRNLQYQNTEVEFSEAVILISEIPENIDQFYANLKGLQVKKIYLQPFNLESHLLYSETIDDNYFQYVYKYIHHKKEFNLQDENIYRELYQKKIPKSIFLYIIRVFFELNFVIIKENICEINENVSKTPLTSSLTYQNMEDWLRMRNLLLTGSIDNLYDNLLK